MIHLIRKKDKLLVVDVAPNHTVIKLSHKGVTTRKAAFKNIRATAALYDAKIGYELDVQDDTGIEPCMLTVTERNIYRSERKPGPKFGSRARK